ncbi:MAG: hypothetical protein QM754_04765 [Tepidisphaeraceae bacterium]
MMSLKRPPVHRWVFALASTCFFLQGCFPVPSTTKVSSEFHGTVVDVDTNLPIQNARIDVTRSTYHAQIPVNSSGEFISRPLLQWHYLAYWGDPGVFPTPIYLRNEDDAPLIVAAWAPGYVSALRVFDEPTIYSTPPGPASDEPLVFRLKKRPSPITTTTTAP